MTNKEYWKGIIPALITPVNKDGSLDLESLEKIIENIISSGCHGLFVTGSSGEPTNLSSKTRREVISQAIRIVNGRLPVCVGTISPGTEQTIELVKEVQNMGCNFICSTPNFYMLNERQEDIIHHFEKVSDRTGVKIMVYNNDATVGQTIKAETFYKITEINNVIAYKDTRPDWENHLKALTFLRDKDISLISGGEYILGPSILMGSQGNIAAASNVFPKLFVALYHAAKAQDIPLTLDLNYKIARLNDVATRTGNGWLWGIKYIAHRFGLCQYTVAGNFTPITKEQEKAIDAMIEELAEYR